jgi:hypothetical protein
MESLYLWQPGDPLTTRTGGEIGSSCWASTYGLFGGEWCWGHIKRSHVGGAEAAGNVSHHGGCLGIP